MSNPTLHSIRCAGVRMDLLKIGPVAALVLSGIAVCLLALAPLGWRLGLWQYRFGLYWIMPVSGLVAAVALILSVPTAAQRTFPHRGFVPWRLSDAGHHVRGSVDYRRHPKLCTRAATKRT